MAKTIGIIPEKIINYKCFIDGEMSPTALVDVDLPDIQFMSETISGACLLYTSDAADEL